MYEDYIGRTRPDVTIEVDRSMIASFARAVYADDPVHFGGLGAASSVPVAPPTFGFVLPYWAAAMGNPVEPDPINELVQGHLDQGALLLHGEQGFTYHRLLAAGDRLTGREEIVDIYEKKGSASHLTFIRTEIEWRDERGTPVLSSTKTIVLKGRLATT